MIVHYVTLPNGKPVKYEDKYTICYSYAKLFKYFELASIGCVNLYGKSLGNMIDFFLARTKLNSDKFKLNILQYLLMFFYPSHLKYIYIKDMSFIIAALFYFT